MLFAACRLIFFIALQWLSLHQLQTHFSQIKSVVLFNCILTNELCENMLSVCTQLLLFSVRDCIGVDDQMFAHASNTSVKAMSILLVFLSKYKVFDYTSITRKTKVYPCFVVQITREVSEVRLFGLG